MNFRSRIDFKDVYRYLIIIEVYFCHFSVKYNMWVDIRCALPASYVFWRNKHNCHGYCKIPTLIKDIQTGHIPIYIYSMPINQFTFSNCRFVNLWRKIRAQFLGI